MSLCRTMSLHFWYEEGGSHRNPEQGTGAGDMPGRQDGIAQCQKPPCGCCRAIGTDPREEKRRARGEGVGQPCASPMCSFLQCYNENKITQEREDTVTVLCLGHCQQKSALGECSTGEGLKSVINPSFRMFTNSQSLLVNTDQK